MGGSPFTLSNGDLLYLAARHLSIDGTSLESMVVRSQIDIQYDLAKDSVDNQLIKAFEYIISAQK
ncbi:hypothetical protein [Eudoraea sp.]|uniref:hypothetical protein n=1 Tax=Eudoraea sp. TaxID=1979955 RepID=UPI003C726EB2